MESSTAIDLEALREDPYAYARAAKERGEKVVGVTPMHFPEELIHAAGALPIVFQESLEPVTVGYSHMFPHFCGFSRSAGDAALKGQYDFLDAVILSDLCVQARWAFQIARRHIKPRFVYMWWPQDYESERLMESVLPGLERVKEALEEIVGSSFGDEEIRASIELFNRHRALLRDVLALRRDKPSLFTAREVVWLVQSSMLVSKEAHIEILERVLAEAGEREAPADTRPRVFASGHLCHAVRAELLDLIEQAGGVVVDDDLYVGTRYAAPEIRTDVPPLEALALRYFDAPCPSKSGQPPEGDWADTILAAVAASGAQGVISFVPRHCEPHMFYYPYVKERLADAGVPLALIETEHEMISLEGTKTRIQALVESIAAPVGAAAGSAR